MTKGVIYLIPVPISEGNTDLVYPLLESEINKLDEFIVENIKTARRSLRAIGFKGEFDKMTFHVLDEHTDVKNIGGLLASVEKGKNIGLLSEAGMPCIADPGAGIVRLAHSKNIRTIPFYGQSSIFLALAASGLNGQNFCFHGYLPKNQAERRKAIKQLDSTLCFQNDKKKSHSSSTHIFIETPYRNKHLLEDILSVCSPTIFLCIARDITGKSEMIVTRTIADWKLIPLPNLEKQPVVFLLGN